MLKDIKLRGRYFAAEATFEMFQGNDRLSIIYGKNGSGKSTITNAIVHATGKNIEGIDYAELLDEKGGQYSDKDNIYVFNEDYVNSKVKFKEDGLNTIILIGDLVGLEERIQNLKHKIEEKNNRISIIKDDLKVRQDADNPKSLSYCSTQIVQRLCDDMCWAGREKEIRNLKRNAPVKENVVNEIIQIQVPDKLDQIRQRFEKNIKLLNQVRENAAERLKDTAGINLKYDEEDLQTLLKQKIEKPMLSDREEKIIHLIECGKADDVEKMQSIFSATETDYCPYCFQEVTSEYKKGLVESIKKVLSKEVDLHKKSLERYLFNNVEVDFKDYEAIYSRLVLACNNKIEEINKEIREIEIVILRKIKSPYEPITDFKTELSDKLKEYEELRLELQEKIITYNKAVDERSSLEKELLIDNKYIAHLELENEIKHFKEVEEEIKKLKLEYESLEKELKDDRKDLNDLYSEKKNTRLAVDLINKSLRYVFFSKDRLEIKVDNDKYNLYARGIPVKPNCVSFGERNIIALCYFFTELLSNQEAKNKYTKKIVAIIDDPVSSFDFDNKVGIMSLLKDKISSIIKNNDESQVAVLTHDFQCYYDLLKIADEIKKEVSSESSGKKKLSYKGMELKNKDLNNLKNNYNEYSELFKIIYKYACDEKGEYEYVIGNVMRRILEAFSTFVYKKGIEEVSTDDTILMCIDDENCARYFKNLMYRLVLHGESHMEERVKALQDTDFLDFISEEAKKRTAREVICFLYKLNSRHVLAHLDGEKYVENNINKWLEQIKELND